MLAIWLTRWGVRHIRPVPLNPAHPMFQQPGGVRLWRWTGGFRLLLIVVAAGSGFALPLGALGRLSEVVGLVCGAVIGYVCQYQLNVLFVVGMIGYSQWSVTHWVVGR
ncbi:MAG: hypothetical protein ACRDTS_22195 [Mycobacterium sp.]